MKKPKPQNTVELFKLMPMRVLRIEPNDIIVLQTDLTLNNDEIQWLRDRASEQFKHHRVAIVSMGMKVGVLREKKRDGIRTRDRRGRQRKRV